MCVMCEEEDLYFLYLERQERAERAARGETTPPNSNWLWPAFPPASGRAPAPAAKPRAATPAFICDAPE